MNNQENSKDPLMNFEEKLTLFFFLVMCASVFLQLFSRFIGKPLVFTEEISRYSYIWIVFFAMSLGVKNKEHIAVSFFKDRFPSEVQKALNMLIDLFSILFFLYLAYYGIQYVIFTKNSLSPALEIPVMVMTISMPLGCAVSALRSMLQFIKKIKSEANKAEINKAY